MAPVNLLIVGAGSRGTGYASYAAAHPDEVRIVGVAEPREIYRQRLIDEYSIAPENVFADWRAAAAVEKFADAVVVATQDAMHVEPAEAFAAKGYHMLLEKPMAPDEEGCRRIHQAVKTAGVMLAVCHVVRYTTVTQKIKQLLDQGAIGDIVSVQRLEPVGYWHQAHSFVRGNWRNEAESSAMLLAKSCHDVDWLRYILGVPCKKVSSFGNLKHFRAEQKPAGAAARCLDCDLASECAYAAQKIYLGRVRDGQTGWPVDVLTPDVDEEAVLQALREGPYGRCVYDCDNDVVDHQVVNFLFESGATAAFTMTAFARGRGRETRIFGTKGELFSDDEKIEVFDFLTDARRDIEIDPTDPSILGGHGGGDYGLMQCFVAAVAEGDPTRILSGPDETLESHLMVFAAERARKNGTVEMVPSV
ncbi:MAG: Gfo/Idh/MocA family oxidoreductase [Candidatus Latescibacteria bacterium]|nr:Gfo/Idh/MocA family oxidoreductase [Candidatus Latescibacterota bacterium]